MPELLLALSDRSPWGGQAAPNGKQEFYRAGANHATIAAMTKWRRWLLALSFCLAAALAVLVYFCWPSRTAINGENYDRVEIGMTLAEVEEILGGPARFEPSDAVYQMVRQETKGDYSLSKPSRLWISDWTGIEVCFDEHSAVIGTARHEVRRVTFLRRVQEVLGL
jgi:hypothetical protein